MRISGRRIQRTRLIHTNRYVVAVNVERVIPDDDPTEPCYEAETVQFPREVEQHAQQGEVNWLAQHGKIYEARSAT